MTEGSDVTRSAYDRWSVFYDKEPNPTVAVDEAHFPGVWRELSGQRVLEIGSETGRHTLKLARQGNEVVGIDLSLGMLAVARKTLRGHPVRLIHADFMTFDELAEGDFDAAVASLVLEHIEDTAAFFLRAARVLKRPARFYLSEIHPLRAATGSQARFVDPETGDERRPANFARGGRGRAGRDRSGTPAIPESRHRRRRRADENRRRLAAVRRQADDQDLDVRPVLGALVRTYHLAVLACRSLRHWSGGVWNGHAGAFRCSAPPK